MRKQLRAFTLIEMLVVIGIIGLLAALLFPALAKAHGAANNMSCLSNLHNCALALHNYQAVFEDYFPNSYFYRNGEGAGNPKPSGDGVLADAGFFHWSAAVDWETYTTGIVPESSGPGYTALYSYPRTSNEYVCPAHTPRGWAPTDFTTGGNGRIPSPPAGQPPSLDTTNALDDAQAPRISYVPNEAIMPQKKFCDAQDQTYTSALEVPGATPASLAAAGIGTTRYLCQVTSIEIARPENTIVLAEMTGVRNSMYGSDLNDGISFVSHRPTNAIVVGTAYTDYGTTIGSTGPYTAANYFNGEQYEIFKGTSLYKLTVDDAWKAINNAASSRDSGDTLADGQSGPHALAITQSRIEYMNPEAHEPYGSNYLFCDGHAATLPFANTLDPYNWMWGDKVYSCADKPVLQVNPHP